jgi:hypothetical protein
MLFTDYLVLFGLISFCAFFTYTVHEVGNAIYLMIDDL